MKVAVFGGSQAKEGSPAYADAEVLGRSLAMLGHTVLTGGYTGVMEATSRGAAAAGGHVIGVTCMEVERSHGRSTNQWVAEEWKRETLIQRLESLIENCDAALALPGGPGTLTEIALMWNLMIVDALDRRPVILIGSDWRAIFDEFFGRLGEYSPPRQRGYLAFAPDPNAAIALLQDLH